MSEVQLDKDNLSNLSDADLFKACKRYGMNPGPVTATTRSIYEKRLKKLLESGPAAAATTTGAATTSVLNDTIEQQRREAEQLAKLKLEQTMLAKQAAERELEVQRQLEIERERDRQRALEREREKVVERERERERERVLAAERERERALAAERERERVLAAEREREREREKQEREREREREREAAQKEQQRRAELAAAKARQQSVTNSGGGSGIPVRVIDTSSGATTATTASNKENLLYPNLDRFTTASAAAATSRPSAFTSSSKTSSAYGLDSGSIRRGDKETTGSLMSSKDMNKPSSKVDVIKILGEPKARSSICPPTAAIQSNASVEEKFNKVTSRSKELDNKKNNFIRSNQASKDPVEYMEKSGGFKQPNLYTTDMAPPTTRLTSIYAAGSDDRASPYLSGVNSSSSTGISPIQARDKYAERLNQYGLLKDSTIAAASNNATLYTTTISPTGIRSRPPLHSSSDKPLLTTSGSVSSTTTDLYNQQDPMKQMSSPQRSTSGNKASSFWKFNYTYVIVCLIATIFIYLIFMQLQPNPPNPVD